MRKSFWLILFPFLFALLFSSCGKLFKKPPEPENPNDNAYRWNTEMRASHSINGEEAEIGKSICSAIATKRDYIKRTWGDNYRILQFRLESLACGESDPEDQGNSDAMVRVPRDGQIYYENRTGYPAIKDMLTEIHPRLKDICEGLLANRNPDNTLNDGSYRYQVSFFNHKDINYLQIAEFALNDGRYLPYLIDISQVFVPADAPHESYIGFVKRRTLNRPCEGARQSRYLDQYLSY